MSGERWTITRVIERDPFGKTIPGWAQHLAILGYREQGWAASDQAAGGQTVAVGEWGDKLWRGDDGVIRCTRYPDGYPHSQAVAS